MARELIKPVANRAEDRRILVRCLGVNADRTLTPIGVVETCVYRKPYPSLLG
jgi:hypothetical protein